MATTAWDTLLWREAALGLLLRTGSFLLCCSSPPSLLLLVLLLLSKVLLSKVLLSKVLLVYLWSLKSAEVCRSTIPRALVANQGTVSSYAIAAAVTA